MRIGLDSRSVTNPSRSRPPITSTTPTSMDNRPARAMRSSSKAASGMIAAAMMGASDESGPSTRMRDGPTSAYTSSGTMVAYRPVTGGRPATSAYPMPAGISSAVSTTPATMSPRSQDRS
ncbi:Uncharacterised protein [Gordonia bronchialis]|nr:Uncharacterised protein [Gordonia bronchialis]